MERDAPLPSAFWTQIIPVMQSLGAKLKELGHGWTSGQHMRYDAKFQCWRQCTEDGCSYCGEQGRLNCIEHYFPGLIDKAYSSFQESGEIDVSTYFVG
jgi:hypothetical protein